MTAATMDPTVGCLEAEAAVLSCLLLLDADSTSRIVDRLEAEDFTDPRHCLVLGAIRRCLDDSVRPDPITVLGELRRSGAERSFTADRAAGTFLIDLAASAPVAASAGHYLRVLHEHRARRGMAEAGERLVQLSGATSMQHAEVVASEEWAELGRLFDRAAGVPCELRR